MKVSGGAITGQLVAALIAKRANTAQMAVLAPYLIDWFNAGPT